VAGVSRVLVGEAVGSFFLFLNFVRILPTPDLGASFTRACGTLPDIDSAKIPTESTADFKPHCW